MSDVRLLTGGEAVAHAMRQIDPDVVPVYPITPQTPIIQTFAKLVADGKASTEIVNVESEHSAMSAAIGAALAGGRTMTATSSQGLALMAEVVYLAASMRAPIVMALGNRALSGPINIHCDHSDSMLIRDSGVVQLFAENAQEAYDLMVMAPRIAEDPRVLLPVLVCLDGFTITHSAEPVSLLRDAEVSRFVGRTAPERRARHGAPDDAGAVRHARLLLRAAPPAGGCARGGSRRPRGGCIRIRTPVGPAVGALEAYRLDDATHAIVALGSTAGTVKDVVDELREEHEAAGLLKLVSFRPFPSAAIAAALERCASVSVLDRADSPGGTPALHAELAAALYRSDVELAGHVYGLGGRELHPPDVREIFSGAAAPYVGLRGETCPV